ncbi:MAG: efflux RND transporter permease subunit [Saprospiraceae bacterium]|nr:efflux RND transporter permease subunit [Saprospiraceae bacterium]
MFIASLIIFSGFGRSFLPEFNEGALTLSVVTKPGTSLEEGNRLGNLVETELLTVPEVWSTARRTGRANSTNIRKRPTAPKLMSILS